MLKKLLRLPVIPLFAIFFIQPVLGGESTVFGPARFERGAGTPATESKTFVSPFSGPGYVLKVHNGDNQSENRTSGATIALNGQTVVKPSDFNQQIEWIERTVPLSLNNELAVTLAGPPGSFITLTITGEHPVPEVSLSAFPETIHKGDPTTLSWNSTNAASCTIDQGIGNVPLTGSVSISPAQTTRYTITVKGPGGTATASVTVTVMSPISLAITSPLDGEPVRGAKALVEGTIVHRKGAETGVTVNGVPAVIYDGKFIVNEVPLQKGENSITAAATDANGNSLSASITLNAETSADCVRIESIAYWGVSPFETTLVVRGAHQEPSLTHTGPGPVEFLSSTNEEEYPIRITTEGVYHFTAEAPDAQGETCSNTLAIVVLNKADLDELLRAKWSGMKSKLALGEIEQALSYFREGSKEDYRQIFTALAANLPRLVSGMQDIEMIGAEDGRAKYRIRRVHAVDGKPVTITYNIYFILDEDGLWKLDRF